MENINDSKFLVYNVTCMLRNGLYTYRKSIQKSKICEANNSKKLQFYFQKFLKMNIFKVRRVII